MRAQWWVIVLAVVVGCKREAAPTRGDETPSGAMTGSSLPTGVAAITGSAADGGVAGSTVDAPVALDAAMAGPARPSETQALEAVKRWIAAAAQKKHDALAAESTLPFTLVDQFSRTSCGNGELSDAKAFAALSKCMGANKNTLRATLGNKDPQLGFWDELPEPPHMIEHHANAWTAVVPPADRAAHAYVTFIGGHPTYWSDILYALFAVRFVDGVPKVTGAVFVFSQEGD